MAYIAKFWRGFFPILIVELEKSNNDDDVADSSEEKQKQAEYDKQFSKLQNLFGDVLSIQIEEDQFSDNLDWLNETMARLYFHSRIYQCSRFFGADVIKTMHFRCPGGCGLRKSNKRKSAKTNDCMKWHRRRSKFIKTQHCDAD